MSTQTLKPTIKSRHTDSKPNQQPSDSHKHTQQAPKEGAFTQVKHDAETALQGREHVVRYGILGFIIAALILFVGLAPTVFLLLFALIGMAIGRYMDGDAKIRALAQKASKSLRG